MVFIPNLLLAQANVPTEVPMDNSVEEGFFDSNTPTPPPVDSFEDEEDDFDIVEEEDPLDEVDFIEGDEDNSPLALPTEETAEKIQSKFDEEPESNEFTEAEATELDEVASPRPKVISTRNFDPSTIRVPGQKKVRKIKHPYSKRGLKRITKNNEYIYAVQPSPRRGASNLMIGTFAPDTFKGTVEIGGEPVDYSEIYDSAVSITVDFEWLKWASPIGEFAVKYGSGFIYSTGKGIFAENGAQSQEEFIFVMLPNTLSLAYRAKLWGSQAIVPYVEGGGGYFTFGELRVDDSRSKFAGAVTYFGAAGVSIDLSTFSEDAILTMDRDYGINAVHLNIEYRIVDGLAPHEIAYNTLAAGFYFEY